MGSGRGVPLSMSKRVSLGGRGRVSRLTGRCPRRRSASRTLIQCYFAVLTQRPFPTFSELQLDATPPWRRLHDRESVSRRFRDCMKRRCERPVRPRVHHRFEGVQEGWGRAEEGREFHMPPRFHERPDGCPRPRPICLGSAAAVVRHQGLSSAAAAVRPPQWRLSGSVCCSGGYSVSSCSGVRAVSVTAVAASLVAVAMLRRRL